jgi:CheY-like chemotaxis protein
MNDHSIILIVDDDPLIMMVIQQIVSRAVSPTAKILTAGDGKEGLEIALKEQPHLIITDLMMPRMDGYDMVQRLRQLKAGCQTKIIGVSCGSLADTHTKAFIKLCDNFLAKPFMPNELIEKLNGFARREVGSRK